MNNTITPVKLFLATCSYKLSGINKPHDSVIKELQPWGNIKSINSNFGWVCEPGYEYLLKKRKKQATSRKLQGSGCCFNSAIEPVMPITADLISKYPLVTSQLNKNKVYKIKCFTSTGVVQIPGVLLGDLSDGEMAINELIAYFRNIHFDIHIEERKIIIMNFNCRIIVPENSLIDFLALYHRLKVGTEDMSVTQIPPPYEESQIKAKFNHKTKYATVKIFQTGKINILGCKSREFAIVIYAYLTNIIQTYTSEIIIHAR